MKNSHFSGQQIIRILKEADSIMRMQAVEIRNHTFSNQRAATRLGS
jgi:hypothetical protein